jgi:hypothetical protein
MTTEKENIEFINEKEEQKDLKGYKLKDFINGNILVRENVVKQMPFITFIAVLAIFYIANSYHAQYMLRKSVQLQTELQELRAESIVTASELMFISRQSEVVKLVKEQRLELKESRVPPIKIK